MRCNFISGEVGILLISAYQETQLVILLAWILRKYT